MDAPPINPNPVQNYKDRRIGLVAFGIVIIGVGCVVALFLPLSFIGQFLGAKSMGVPPNYQVLAQTLLMYGLLALALIWLGAGSIRAGRWDKALLVIFTSSWLVIGFFTVIAFLMVMPKAIAGVTEAQPVPQVARTLMLLLPFVMLTCAFILLPLGLLLFYSSSHVKATCEARDPVERWTDRTPLPVIGAGLWVAFGALMLLSMPLSARGVIPAFGRILSGASGSVVLVTMAAIWFYCAWAIYRLQPAGWWLLIATIVLSVVSTVMTYSKIDIGEMYRLMGYPDVQIERMLRFNFVNGTILTICSVGSSLLALGYLIWLKRFFPRSTQSGAGSLAAVS